MIEKMFTKKRVRQVLVVPLKEEIASLVRPYLWMLLFGYLSLVTLLLSVLLLLAKGGAAQH